MQTEDANLAMRVKLIGGLKVLRCLYSPLNHHLGEIAACEDDRTCMVIINLSREKGLKVSILDTRKRIRK